MNTLHIKCHVSYTCMPKLNAGPTLVAITASDTLGDISRIEKMTLNPILDSCEILDILTLDVKRLCLQVEAELKDYIFDIDYSSKIVYDLLNNFDELRAFDKTYEFKLMMVHRERLN